ncbi:MAG: hypothetical protein JWN28_695 [Candidatus Saccharibacteria bacterium]|nr:hypothetical protein [Candidatus Saccharibacteria bacterium]
MTDKVERQYFKSYLAMIDNSVGTEMFRSFYVRVNDGPVTDIIGSGENACAFYVSTILLVFGKQKSVHATVKSVITDLEESGWELVDENDMKAGDVIVWSGRDDDNPSQHIGFYIGDNLAISTSSNEQKVFKHDIHFGQVQRKIMSVYRSQNW